MKKSSLVTKSIKNDCDELDDDDDDNYEVPPRASSYHNVKMRILSMDLLMSKKAGKLIFPQIVTNLFYHSIDLFSYLQNQN